MNRKAIIWHDMLLPEKFSEKNYYANSTCEVSEILLNSLDKNIIVADWEYEPHGEIWETSVALKEREFEVLCCPWSGIKNINEAVNTVSKEHLSGVIYTTWQTLSSKFKSLVYAGVLMYDADVEKLKSDSAFYSANVVRKAFPFGGVYENSGWRKNWRE